MKKNLAIILSVSLFLQAPISGLAEASIWEERLAALPSSPLPQLPSITKRLSTKMQQSFTPIAQKSSKITKTPLLEDISQAHLRINKVFRASSKKSPTVLLIQDVHLHPEAQLNVAHVLDSLLTKKKIKTVAIEGAFGPLDFSSLRSYPSQDIKEEIGRAFVQKKLMAAASYVGLVTKAKDFQFIGVDSEKHYRANVAAYLEGQAKKKDVTANLNSKKNDLVNEKRKIFNPKLKKWDNLKEAYSIGQFGFADYVKQLSKMVPVKIHRSSSFSLFLKAYELETTLNFTRAEEERRTVIEKLTARLTKEELSKLVTQSLDYRLGKVSFSNYYQDIKNLCQKKGIQLTQYAEFDRYISYVLLADRIQPAKLFADVKEVEGKVVDHLVRTRQERDLVKQDQRLRLEQKLVNFELTPADWEEYQERGGSSLRSFEEFYRQADIRSERIVENLLEQDGKSLALIVGGFHSQLIMKRLKEKNISHILTTPKITKVENVDGTAYLSVFSRDRTPLEQLFEGKKLSVIPESQNISYAAFGRGIVPAELAVAHHQSGLVSDQNGLISIDLDEKLYVTTKPLSFISGLLYRVLQQVLPLSGQSIVKEREVGLAPLGGLMDWVRQSVFPWLSKSTYNRWAYVLENVVFGLVIGLPMTLIGIFTLGLDPVLAIRIGNAFLWAIFVVGHIPVIFPKMESWNNFKFALPLGLINIAFSFFMPSLFFLGLFLAFGFFSHFIANKIGAWIARRRLVMYAEPVEEQVEFEGLEQAVAYVRKVLPPFLNRFGLVLTNGETVIERVEGEAGSVSGGVLLVPVRSRQGRRNIILKISLRFGMSFKDAADLIAIDQTVFDALHQGNETPVIPPPTGVGIPNFLGRIVSSEDRTTPIVLIEEFVEGESWKKLLKQNNVTDQFLEESAIRVMKALMYFRENGFYQWDPQASDFLFDGDMVNVVDLGSFKEVTQEAKQAHYLPARIGYLVSRVTGKELPVSVLNRLIEIYEAGRTYELIPKEIETRDQLLVEMQVDEQKKAVQQKMKEFNQWADGKPGAMDDASRVEERFDTLVEIARRLLVEDEELYQKYMNTVFDPLMSFSAEKLNFILLTRVRSGLRSVFNALGSIRDNRGESVIVGLRMSQIRQSLENLGQLELEEAQVEEAFYFEKLRIPVIGDIDEAAREKMRALEKFWLSHIERNQGDIPPYIDNILGFSLEDGIVSAHGITSRDSDAIRIDKNPSIQELLIIASHEGGHEEINQGSASRSRLERLEQDQEKRDLRLPVLVDWTRVNRPIKLIEELHAYARGWEVFFEVYEAGDIEGPIEADLISKLALDYATAQFSFFLLNQLMEKKELDQEAQSWLATIGKRWEALGAKRFDLLEEDPLADRFSVVASEWIEDLNQQLESVLSKPDSLKDFIQRKRAELETIQSASEEESYQSMVRPWVEEAGSYLDYLEDDNGLIQIEEGGRMHWLRAAIFKLPFLSATERNVRFYNQAAFLIENTLVFMLMGLMISFGMEFRTALVVSWVLFVALHFIDWIFSAMGRMGRAPPRNAWLWAPLVALSTILIGLIFSDLSLLFIVIAFIPHLIINTSLYLYRNGSTLNQRIFDHYYLSEMIANLKSSDPAVQAGVAQSFGKLAVNMIKADPSLDLVRRELFSVYPDLIDNLSGGVVDGATSGLGDIAAALLELDPSGKLIETEWMNLYRTAAEQGPHNARENAGNSLGTLAKSLLKADSSGALLKKIWIPLYVEAVGFGSTGFDRGDSHVASGVAKNWRDVIEGIRLAPPEVRETLLTDVAEKYYEAALAQPENEMREGATNALGHYGQLLLEMDPTGRQFNEKWLPLYQRAADRYVNNAPIYFGQILTDLITNRPRLNSPEIEEKFLDVIIPLYKEGLESEKLRFRESVRGHFGRLAQEIVDVDPTGRLLREKYLPLFEAVYISKDGARRMNGVWALGGLAEAVAKITNEEEYTRMEAYVIAFYNGHIIEPDEINQKETVKSLPGMATMLLSSDPSGTRFKEEWYSFQFKAFDNVRGVGGSLAIGEAGIDTAAILLEVDPSGKLLKEKGLDLIIEGFGQLSNVRNPEEKAKSFHRLLKALLQADPSILEDLREGLTNVFRQMTIGNILDSVQENGVSNLEEVGLLLLKLDPNGTRLLPDIWNPMNLSTANDDYVGKAAKVLGAFATQLDARALLETPQSLWNELQIQESMPSGHREDSAARLALSLFQVNDLGGLSSPTQTWIQAIDILRTLRSSSIENSLLRILSNYLMAALQVKGAPLNKNKIKKAYRNYFDGKEVPPGYLGPKDLVAHVILDYELQRRGLPADFGRYLRSLRTAPSYGVLLPLLRELGEGNSVLINAIKDFPKWGKNQDVAYRLILLAARDYKAFYTLRVTDDVVALLTPEEASGNQKEKIKKLEAIIPSLLGTVFHFEAENMEGARLVEKELNVIRYVARHSDFKREENPLNIVLRAYFKARLNGEGVEKAIVAYEKERERLVRAEFDGELLDELPPPVEIETENRVFLSGMSVRQMTISGEFGDGVRHLKELKGKIPKGSEKTKLEGLLDKLRKNPNEEEMGEFIESINQWIAESEKTLEPFNSLVTTIQGHFEKVAALLSEEEVGEAKQSALSRGGDVPYRDIVIRRERNPINKIHLGWPSLGGSCLDCIGGTYQEYAGSYATHAYVEVIYIWEKNKTKKPLARISVGMDPETKTLFPISPIKASVLYDYDASVGTYLSQWADEIGWTVLGSDKLGFYQSMGDQYNPGQRRVTLPKGLMPFYSDLTLTTQVAWESLVKGMMYTGRSEAGGRMMWLRSAIFGLPFLSATERNLRIYDHATFFIENLLVYGMMGLMIYFGMDFRWALVIAWALFWALHLPDLASSRAPPQNVYLWAPLIALLSIGIGLFFSNISLLLLAVLLIPHFVVNYIPSSSTLSLERRISDLYYFREAFSYFESSDLSIRRGAVRALGSLAESLLRADDSGALFKKEGLSLFKMALADPDSKVYFFATDQLGELAESLLNADHSGSLFKTIWLDLYQEAMANKDKRVHAEAVGNLAQVAESLLKVDSSGRLFEEVGESLFETALAHEDSAIHIKVAENMGALAESLFRADPSGALFKKIGLKLIDIALADENHQVRKGTKDGLRTLAENFLIANPSGTLFQYEAGENEPLLHDGHWYIRIDTTKGMEILIESLMQRLNLKVDDAILSNGKWFISLGADGLLGGMNKLLTYSDSSALLFKEGGLRLYKLALEDSTNENETIRRSAANNLGGVAEILLETDPMGGAFHVEGKRLYELALADAENAVRMRAAGTLGKVSQALLKADPSGDLFKRDGLRLYEIAMRDKSEEVRRWAVESFILTTESLLEADPTGRLFKESGLLFLNSALADESWFVRLGAIKNLEGLVESLKKTNASTTLFKETCLSLFKKSMAREPQEAIKQLGYLVEGMLWVDPSGRLLEEEGVGFFEGALESEDKTIRKSVASNLEPLTKHLLKADPSAGLFKKIGLPLFNRALADQEEDVRELAAESWARGASSLDAQILFLSPEEIKEEYTKKWGTVKERAMIVLQLLLARLIPISSGSLKDPTKLWVFTIGLLKDLRSEGSLDPSLSQRVSHRLIQMLSMKFNQMDVLAIETAYKNYFNISELPRGRSGPKDLISHVLLDFELNRRGLPLSYGNHLMKIKRSPGYATLHPIISQLVQGNNVFIEAIQGFDAWGGDLVGKEKDHYWGSVHRILSVTAREWTVFESLGTTEHLEAMASFRAQSENVSRAGGKRKFLQQQANRVDPKNIIVGFAGKVLHINNVNKLSRVKLTEKELNTLIYLARNGLYHEKENALNIVFRSYFEVRLNGGSDQEAIRAYQNAMKGLEGMQELLGALTPFLEENGVLVKAPKEFEGKVFLGIMSGRQKQIRVQWADGIRHLKEIAVSIAPGRIKSELENLIGEIPQSPAEPELRRLVRKISEWIPGARGELLEYEVLVEAVIGHVEEIGRLLDVRDSSETEVQPDSNRPLEKDVVITRETHPVEILHLGWRKLGESCLDCIDGPMREFTGGYVVHPFVQVVYIWEKGNKNKPLARVSIALDPVGKSLFAASPIKTSSNYDAQAIVGQYLKDWADELGWDVVAPTKFLFDDGLGSGYEVGKKKVSLPKPIIPFYSDISSRSDGEWEEEIAGYVYQGNSREEIAAMNDTGGRVIWLRSAIFKLPFLSETDRAIRIYNQATFLIENLLVYGMMGLMTYFGMDFRWALIMAWALFWALHLPDLASSRAPPQNVYLWAPLVALLSIGIGLFFSEFSLLLLAVLLIPHFIVNFFLSPASIDEESEGENVVMAYSKAGSLRLSEEQVEVLFRFAELISGNPLERGRLSNLLPYFNQVTEMQMFGDEEDEDAATEQIGIYKKIVIEVFGLSDDGDEPIEALIEVGQFLDELKTIRGGEDFNLFEIRPDTNVMDVKTVETKYVSEPDPSTIVTAHLEERRVYLPFAKKEVTYLHYELRPSVPLVSHGDVDTASFHRQLKIISLVINLLINGDKEIRSWLKVEAELEIQKVRVGYHGEDKLPTLLNIIGMDRGPLKSDIRSYFIHNPNKLVAYISDDFLFDVVNQIGNKVDRETGVFFKAMNKPTGARFMENTMDYLNRAHAVETASDESAREKVLKKLSRRRQFALQERGPRRRYIRTSESEGTWLPVEHRPVHTVNAETEELAVVDDVTVMEFVEMAKKQKPSSGVIFFPTTWFYYGRYFVLAARDGVLELYYTSETYSKAFGQPLFNRLTAWHIRDMGTHLQSGWIFKDNVEMVSYLPLWMGQAINQRIANNEIRVQQSEGVGNIINQLIVLVGAAVDHQGRLLAYDEKSELVPINPVTQLDLSNERERAAFGSRSEKFLRDVRVLDIEVDRESLKQNEKAPSVSIDQFDQSIFHSDDLILRIDLNIGLQGGRMMWLRSAIFKLPFLSETDRAIRIYNQATFLVENLLVYGMMGLMTTFGMDFRWALIIAWVLFALIHIPDLFLSRAPPQNVYLWAPLVAVLSIGIGLFFSEISLLLLAVLLVPHFVVNYFAPSSPFDSLWVKNSLDIYLMSKAMLNLQGDELARLGTVKNLGTLAVELMKQDKSGRALERVWVPLFERALRDKNGQVFWEAAKSLGPLAQTLVELDSSPRLLEKIWIPLYERTLSADPMAARALAVNLEPLTESLMTIDPTGNSANRIVIPLLREAVQNDNIHHEDLGYWASTLLKLDSSASLLEELWVPGFRKYLSGIDESSHIDEGLIESLGPLAREFIELDPTGDLLERVWRHLYWSAMTHDRSTVRFVAVEVLNDVAEGLLKTDPSGTSLKRVWVPLYLSVLNNTEKKPSYDYDPTPKYSLPQDLIKDGGNGDVLADVWIPLYEWGRTIQSRYVQIRNLDILGGLAMKIGASDRSEQQWREVGNRYINEGLNNDNEVVRREPAKQLGDLAKGLMEVDPEGNLLKEIWVPLYEKAIGDKSRDVRIAAVASLNQLLQTLLELNQGFAVLEEIGIPLYEQALRSKDEAVRDQSAETIVSFVKAQLKGGQEQSWKTIAVDLMSVDRREGGFATKLAIVKNLEALVDVLLEADPSGALLIEDWIPLYERAIQSDPPNDIVFTATRGLGRLAFRVGVSLLLSRPKALWKELNRRNQMDGANPIDNTARVSIVHLTSHLFQGRLEDPTSVWEPALNALTELRDPEFLASPLARELSGNLVPVLVMKGAPMDLDVIEAAYRKYFDGAPPPSGHAGPKDMIAHIVLDYQLRRLGLPLTYGVQIRSMKNSPGYEDLLPILQAIDNGNTRVIEAIRGFTSWSDGLQADQVRTYWGVVNRLFVVATRDWSAFEWLEATDQLFDAMKSYEIENPARGKVRFLQKKVGELEKAIPNYASRIFGLEIEEPDWKKPSEKEMNVLRYIAGDSEFQKKSDSLNRVLRAYYEVRLTGGSEEEAVAAYERALQELDEVKAVVEPLKPFLDETGVRVRAPEEISSRVFLSGISIRLQGIVRHQTDAVRHVRELNQKLREGQAKRELGTLLEKIPKNPSEEETATIVNEIKAWIQRFKKELANENDLVETIIGHLDEVERLLKEEEPKRGRKILDEPPIKNVVIAQERNPINIIHLGWPSLGGSCLDCVRGTYKQYAGGNVTHPYLEVVYIWDADKNKREKPLARISVGVDPINKVLFVLSPVKTSSSYEYQPVVGEYLTAWADELGWDVIAPTKLDYDEKLGDGSGEFEEGERDAALLEGVGKVYSDLTGQDVWKWNGRIKGMMYTSSLEGGRMMWLRSAIFKLPFLTETDQAIRIYNHATFFIENLLVYGMMGLMTTFGMDFRWALVLAWVLFWALHLPDLASSRAPPQNVYLWAPLVAVISIGIGLFFSNISILLLAVLFVPHFVVNLIPSLWSRYRVRFYAAYWNWRVPILKAQLNALPLGPARDNVVEKLKGINKQIQEIARIDYESEVIEKHVGNLGKLSRGERQRITYLIRLARELSGKTTKDVIKVLDVGTGPGNHIVEFNKRQNVEAYGVEVAKTFIEILRRLKEEGLIPDFFERDMIDLHGIEDESMDVVRHQASLLHHLDAGPGIGVDVAVAEAHRVLKEDGVYYLAVKAGKGFSVDKRGRRIFQLFDEQSVRDLLERNGFEVISTETKEDNRQAIDQGWVFAYAKKSKTLKESVRQLVTDATADSGRATDLIVSAGAVQKLGLNPKLTSTGKIVFGQLLQENPLVGDEQFYSFVANIIVEELKAGRLTIEQLPSVLTRLASYGIEVSSLKEFLSTELQNTKSLVLVVRDKKEEQGLRSIINLTNAGQLVKLVFASDDVAQQYDGFVQEMQQPSTERARVSVTSTNELVNNNMLDLGLLQADLQKVDQRDLNDSLILLPDGMNVGGMNGISPNILQTLTILWVQEYLLGRPPTKVLNGLGLSNLGRLYREIAINA